MFAWFDYILNKIWSCLIFIRLYVFNFTRKCLPCGPSITDIRKPLVVSGRFPDFFDKKKNESRSSIRKKEIGNSLSDLVNWSKLCLPLLLKLIQTWFPHRNVIIFPSRFWGRKSVLIQVHFSWLPKSFQLNHRSWYDICAEKISIKLNYFSNFCKYFYLPWWNDFHTWILGYGLVLVRLLRFYFVGSKLEPVFC